MARLRARSWCSRRPASIPGAVTLSTGVGPRSGMDIPRRGRRPGSVRRGGRRNRAVGPPDRPVAWPDRSAPASAVSVFAFNALVPSPPPRRGPRSATLPRSPAVRTPGSRPRGPRLPEPIGVRSGDVATARSPSPRRASRDWSHCSIGVASSASRTRDTSPRVAGKARAVPGGAPASYPRRSTDHPYHPRPPVARGRPQPGRLGRTTRTIRPDDPMIPRRMRPSGTIDDLSMTGAVSYLSLPPELGRGQQNASEIPSNRRTFASSRRFPILLNLLVRPLQNRTREIMRLGILSDTHDRIARTEAAVRLLVEVGRGSPDPLRRHHDPRRRLPVGPVAELLRVRELRLRAG